MCFFICMNAPRMTTLIYIFDILPCYYMYLRYVVFDSWNAKLSATMQKISHKPFKRGLLRYQKLIWEFSHLFIQEVNPEMISILIYSTFWNEKLKILEFQCFSCYKWSYKGKERQDILFCPWLAAVFKRTKVKY